MSSPDPHRARAAAPARSRLDWAALGASTEARLLAVGLLGTLGLTLAFGIGVLWQPPAALHAAAVVGLNIMLGSVAGMSYGLAAGFGIVPMALFNFAIEALQVLVIYPLFALAWRHLIDPQRLAPRLAAALARLQAAAESGQGWVRHWGMAGVALFVFTPFMMTGPVVGAVLGHLLGLRPLLNVAVVLAATGASIVVYALFLDQVTAWADAAHPYAMFGTIVALAVVAWLVQRWR